MALLLLLWRQSDVALVYLALLSGTAGVGNALVMAVASDTAASGHADLRRLLLFILAVLIYAVAQRVLIRRSAREIERIVHDLRIRVLDSLRNAQVPDLLRLQASEVYAAVTRDSQSVSQAATALTLASQAALLLTFALLYILWISTLEFSAAVLSALLLGVFAARRAARERVALDAAIGQERDLLSDMLDVIDGFKETKTSPRRARAQFAALAARADVTAASRSMVDGRAAGSVVTMQTGLYLMLALLAFGLPEVATIEPAAQRKTVTALLFAAGSVGVLVQSLPLLALADEAAASLARLAAALPPERSGHAPLADGPPLVELRAAAYTWRGSSGETLFNVGPLDLRLGAGEVVFVTGGNGSGKSTLLHMVAGLLPLDRGALLCNGEGVTDQNLQTYRDRVASIFSGDHLFRRPYGPVFDPIRFDGLLQDLGLGGKVLLGSDGSWNGPALSTGQRKRLAMVELLLGDPSIVVLDEWAADQDPTFRRHFYEALLPTLRARGCAVLCATHDDRFFASADRRYEMRDGRLVPAPGYGALEPSEVVP